MSVKYEEDDEKMQGSDEMTQLQPSTLSSPTTHSNEIHLPPYVMNIDIHQNNTSADEHDYY